MRLNCWTRICAVIIVGAATMPLPTSADDSEVRRDYPIRPVPFTAVKVADEFWSPRMKTNREVTVWYDFKKCEETGRIDNFAVAGGLKKGGFQGIFFNDSDVVKFIEGAAYTLAVHADPKLDGIHDLMEFNINELWLIQINSSACGQVPEQITEIKDRQNELAANISMEQELRFVETINRAIAKGFISNPKYHPILVGRIQLDRDLGYASKMSRSPSHLEDLQQYGQTKARGRVLSPTLPARFKLRDGFRAEG